MPLQHSASKAAFKENVKTEMEAHPGKENRARNLAIAYSVQRRAGHKKMSKGGMYAKGGPVHDPSHGERAPGGPGVSTPGENAKPSVSEQYRQFNTAKSAAERARPYAEGGNVSLEQSKKQPDFSDMKQGEHVNIKGLGQHTYEGRHSDGDHMFGAKDGSAVKIPESDLPMHVERMAEGGMAASGPTEAEYHKQPGEKPYPNNSPVSAQGRGASERPMLKEMYEQEPTNMSPSTMRNRSAAERPTHMQDNEYHIGDHDPDESASGFRSGDSHVMSIADAILAKRKKMAKGGMVDDDQADVDRNAIEYGNEEDDMSYDARNRESYSEKHALDEIDNHMDSGQHGDDIDMDEHDMVDEIRRKMRMKRSMGA